MAQHELIVFPHLPVEVEVLEDARTEADGKGLEVGTRQAVAHHGVERTDHCLMRGDGEHGMVHLYLQSPLLAHHAEHEARADARVAE